MRIVNNYFASFVICQAPMVALAFPTYLKVSDANSLQGVMQKNIIGFSTIDNGKVFNKIPFHVDEVESNAFLVLRSPDSLTEKRNQVNHPPSKDPFNGRLGDVHRLVFDDSFFGECTTKECLTAASVQAKNQCLPFGGLLEKLVRVEDPLNKKVVFLAQCNKAVSSPTEKNIKYDMKKQKVSTTQFAATLSEKSPFVFTSAGIFGDEKMLTNFDLKAKLKTKLLITININPDDLKGEVVSISNKALASSLEIASTDSFMGIKTTNQVCCDITFYKDALYFPIFITPPSSIGALRSGSYVSLGFNTSLPIQTETTKDNIPYFIFEAPKGALALLFSPLGFENKTLPVTLLSKKAELEDNGLEKNNAGLRINLENQIGEQRLEAWFLTSTSKETIKKRVEASLHLISHDF